MSLGVGLREYPPPDSLWPREMSSRNCLQTSLLSADCLVAADIYCSVDAYGMILVKYSNFLSCSTTSDAILTDFGLRLCKTSTGQNKYRTVQVQDSTNIGQYKYSIVQVQDSTNTVQYYDFTVR